VTRGVTVALVTGASRGIGAATARRLAADGRRVVIAARSSGPLDALVDEIAASGGTALAVPTDLTDPAAIDALVDATRQFVGESARLDVLVNNAGVLPAATRAERMPLGDWQHTLMLNLTSPWYLATRAHALMAEGSVVVNVSSSAAFYPSVGLSAYNASKSALNTVTRGLALEWARDGIRVVGVAPGLVDTELAVPITQWMERTDQRVNPIGRLGTADEVAELIAFVASDRAAYMTGSVVTLDGGELLTASSEAPK
jgi:NAD(P)-dependent dehydrogenase (short-subunit alcohol dehydrogenase family)